MGPGQICSIVHKHFPHFLISEIHSTILKFSHCVDNSREKLPSQSIHSYWHPEWQHKDSLKDFYQNTANSGAQNSSFIVKKYLRKQKC